MIRLIIINSIIILLSGCSIFNPKTEYIEVAVEVEKKCVTQFPDDLVLRDIDWVVVNRYWVALSPEDYEDISLNTSDMLKHIRQSKTIITKCMGD